MSAPAVSVVMSAYNAERYVGLAIESVLAQTFSDFEFLILDDGSNDGTAAILQAYASADLRIRIIRRENRGLVASLNELVAEARAPLVARMDADDVALPERFAKQVAFLSDNPDFGVVGTCATRVDGEGRICADAAMNPPTSHEAFVGKVGRGLLLIHSSVMYRKSVVVAAGGYHPAFRHCEDLDLWLRLASRTKICSLPEALMHYRRTDTQVSTAHVIEQNVNAAIAIHAWRLRAAGRPDPTGEAARLPALSELDLFFGEAGVEKKILAYVIPHLLHSKQALTTGGLDLIARHVAYGNDRAGLWRTVGRLLLVFRAPRPALSLAGLLLSPPALRPAY